MKSFSENLFTSGQLFRQRSCLDDKQTNMKLYRRITTLIALILVALMSSCEDEVVTPNENRLVAVAGDDQSMMVNHQILLDATASYDGNNKSFTYQWTIKTRPAGSVASLSAPHAAQTFFTAKAAGTYVIELKIEQNGFQATDLVTLTVMSPEPEEPTSTVLREDINANTVLSDIFPDERPDYIVAETIVVRAALKIQPGVVIAFQADKGLEIFAGSITAQGTAEKPITFQGVNPGSTWRGIVIYSNSELNEFNHVHIRQGGSYLHAETGVRANIAVVGDDYSGGAIKIKNTTSSGSGGYGLFVKGLSSVLAFTNNTFSDNAEGIFIPGHELHKLDIGVSQGITDVETGGLLLHYNEVTWKALTEGSYIVTRELLIRAGVTVEPGATFRMKNGVTININGSGYLRAIGTAEKSITFTSTSADTYWNGLFFNSTNTNNELRYANVEYAGLNRIGDADHHANVVVGRYGKLLIEHSSISNGIGYGLVTKSIGNVNFDLINHNTFANLPGGYVFPTALYYPDKPELAGEWLDYWSFNRGETFVSDNYYNKESGVWFEGAATPWEMTTGNGIGIRFHEDGRFTWIIAEISPMMGCVSYSAEYITGSYTSSEDAISFDQDFWKSKFVNRCNESQNVDTEVTPQQIDLPYEITKMHNMWTGESYWMLTFKNPDQTTFSFYRR